MKQPTSIICLLLGAGVIGGASCDFEAAFPPYGMTTVGSQALFDQVWRDFDENYSYFSYKAIDWEQMRMDHRPDFADELSVDEFAERLAPMLRELHDWHVNIALPDGGHVPVYEPGYMENYPQTPRNRYVQGGYVTIGDGVIHHGIVGSNLGYIRIATLETNRFAEISDADIEDLFVLYANTDGMIIDIRPNSGGNDLIAQKFASHFTDVATDFGYTRTRNGASHADFDPLQVRTLQPSTSGYYDGPVVCLIGQRCLSSAEWFALMMRACPNVMLMGDCTRGGSGNPAWFELSNGLQYRMSTWVAYTLDMIEFEDRGIEPDIAIESDQSFNSEHDYVLESAIEVLEGP